jgi:hypothetical protein
VLKRWLRHAENLSHKGKRSGKGLIDFQVGNEKGSMDLVNCQVGRRDIPDFQVGKDEEMRSDESSHQRMLIDEEEAEGIPHSEGYLHGVASRVNEDDEKLQTSTIEEKDQGSILIIGGVEIFLPSGRGEASIDVVNAIKTTRRDCLEGEGTDTEVCPNRRRREFNRIAQPFQPGR